jgi:transposase-like protein
MMECESCNADVERVLRHREYGVAMTHRVTRWLCRDCHPAVPSREPSPAEAGTKTVVTDGGSPACPDCSSATVNVHGVQDCVACGWNAY